MKVYNRSLDYVALAMATARGGDAAKAAKLFAKAIQEPDAVRAVAILEASNKQAFTAAKVEAKAAKTVAAKRLKANEEFDMGDDEDLDDLAGGEVDAATEDEDEEDEDEGFDAEFAKVLSSMTKARVRK